jgi:hypothetical protein
VDTNSPSLDEWRQLYDAAIAFQKVGPWEWMVETETFGVQNPETGQVGYGSIMGMQGEHFALSLYLGSEGLQGFIQLEQDEGGSPELLFEIPQLQASFQDRDILREEDRAVIKTLGLKFRGRNAWPMFRNYTPGYFPWFVSSEEARFLTWGLQQAQEVALRVEENPALLDPLTDDVCLIRTPEKRGKTLEWRDEWVKLPPPIGMKLPVAQINEVALAAIRSKLSRRSMRIETDLFLLPAYIQERKDERPFLTYHLMVVDAASGFILGADVIDPRPTLDTMWAKAADAFVKAVRTMGFIPSHVMVSNRRMESLLGPIAVRLGIQLKLVRSLPALEEARTAMEQWMRR